MVTFDYCGRNKLDSFITSIYFIATDDIKVDELRQTIGDDKDKLLGCKRSAPFGWVQLWKTFAAEEEDDNCNGAALLSAMTVEQVPPVYHHQIVTEDTIQNYVSELLDFANGQRQLGESDYYSMPWRIYLIPLPVSASCCIVIQSHPVVMPTIDNIIRRVIHWSPSTNIARPRRTQVAPTRFLWTKRIPKDLIERICRLTGASIQQTVMAAWIQSFYDFFKHSQQQEDEEEEEHPSSCTNVELDNKQKLKTWTSSNVLDLRVEMRSEAASAVTTIRSVCIRSSSEVEDWRLVLNQLTQNRPRLLVAAAADRKHFTLATVVLETVIDESTFESPQQYGSCLLQWPSLDKGAIY